jgi:hypothetical protein
VPFHRTEFTAKSITACFSLDAPKIRDYGLLPEATAILRIRALWKVRRSPSRSRSWSRPAILRVRALWKVRKFLDSDMRLSAFPDRSVSAMLATRPSPAHFFLTYSFPDRSVSAMLATTGLDTFVLARIDRPEG